MTSRKDEAVQHIVQYVKARGGYAYATAIGDIYISADGSLRYLLEAYSRRPTSDPAWLREVPSRMLNADHALVPFTGRETELEDLVEWRDGGTRLAACWLHGPGGLGKTRLAARLADVSADAGWLVAKATHGPGAILPQLGPQNLLLTGQPGVLLIVDYADRWTLSHMTWLLSNALLYQGDARARVLLIGRSLEPWPAVRAQLEERNVSPSARRLSPLPDGEDQRLRMFIAARDTFAALFRNITELEAIAPPEDLDRTDFGVTLNVHTAALVAVDAHAHGRPAPTGQTGMTRHLLDRERAHWTLLYEKAARGLDYRTSPGEMSRLVFIAALTGSVSHRDGTALLRTLDLEAHPERAVADHLTCYPASSLGDPSVLQPLYPDRLAEDFLALTLPGHPADHPSAAWAPSTLAAVLARRSDGTPPGYVTRALTFLAAAAGPGRWPHVADHLTDVLRADPQLAVDAGSVALTALADVPGLAEDTLAAVEAELPYGRHADLDLGIAAVTKRLTELRLAHSPGPADRADLHWKLTPRLANAGRYQDALKAAEEAVEQYRDLARDDPARYNARLANALDRHGTSLWALGRHRQAQTVSAEAVELHRALTEAEPATHEGGLANALANLGVSLWALGRNRKAQAATEEALDIYRRLVTLGPAKYDAGLADTLHNYGNDLYSIGEHRKAFKTAEQAVKIYRRLAADDPARYEADLADVLDALGVRLWALRQPAAALAPAEEALAIRRRLSTANPAAHEPDLADSFDNLGLHLRALRRDEEALALSEQGLAIRRRLAAASPGTQEPDLANALNNLGLRYEAAGRHQEAVDNTAQAVAIYRRLAEDAPAAYRADLAGCLNNLSLHLRAVRRPEDAVVVNQEAVSIRRLLAATDPALHEADLAQSVDNLGLALRQLGRFAEAVEACQEAVARYRRLAATDPDYAADLADALDNLGAALTSADQVEASLAASQDEVKLYRSLGGFK